MADANEVVEGMMAQALIYLDSAVNMLALGYLNEGILLAAREILASIGESHSAYVLASVLRTKGLKVELVDLAGSSDSRALNISERIKDAFDQIDLMVRWSLRLAMPRAPKALCGNLTGVIHR